MNHHNIDDIMYFEIKIGNILIEQRVCANLKVRSLIYRDIISESLNWTFQAEMRERSTQVCKC